MSCAGCQYLMLGRWAPWCHKAKAPLLTVKECPCPREPVYFEPLDLREIVRRSREAVQ